MARSPLILALLGCCALGLWSPAGLAARDKAPPPAAEPTEPLPPTEEERTLAFAEYKDAVAAGRKTAAADALVALVQDPLREPFHAESWPLLGALLMELDLPYSALIAYRNALSLSKSPDPASIEGAIRIADSVGDTGILEPVFAKNVGGDVDKLIRSRMAFLAARENHRAGSYGVALGMLKLVVPASPIYPEAKMLEGVVLNDQGVPLKGLESMLAALEAARKTERSDRFLDTLHMNVARSYYSAENYPRAIEYYAQVRRSSDYWLDAQFERAWAHFRLDDMNGALALLQVHQSPFFGTWYYPEAELLRVYALFLLCKFPEASLGISSFKDHYQPVFTDLQGSMASLGPPAAWNAARDYVGEGKVSLPEMMLRPFTADERFHDAIAAVGHADDELARMENISSNPFVSPVSGWLKDRRGEIVRTEGERVLARMQFRADELSRMLNDAEMSRLDMLQMETRLYEQASVMGSIEVERRVNRQSRIRQGFVWWPWEGEYWADEIGYYRVETVPECPEGLRTTAP